MTWLMISQVRQSLKLVLGLLVNKNKALGLSIFVLAMRAYGMVVVFPGGDVLRDGHQSDAKDECILSARCAVDCTTKLCSAAGSVGKLEKSQRRDHNAHV